MTVGQTLARGIGALSGSASPRADALLLLSQTLGCRREWIFAHGDAPAPDAVRKRFFTLCEKRAEGRPLAYVLGSAGFYGREFSVDDRVLVPRPETEHLVEEALAFLRSREAGEARQPTVLDVGTGSGAIACTIAAEHPRAFVDATDRSAQAIEVALGNSRALGVAERCRFWCGDLGAPVAGRRFDAVLANLPYVETGNLPQRPDPAGFEPRAALDGGRDGLEPYRRFVAAAPAFVAPGGILLLEAAPHQMEQLAALVATAFREPETTIGRDFAGLRRYVKVRSAAG